MGTTLCIDAVAEGLPHDVPTEDLAVDVAIVRLAHDQVLQVRIFKPSRVVWLHPRLKGEATMVDGVDEEIVNDQLLLEGWRHFEKRVCIHGDPSFFVLNPTLEDF